MTTTTLTVLGHGQVFDLRKNESLLSALRRQAPDLAPVSPCGGKHTCGKCRIIVKSGAVSSPTETELSFLSSQELSDGVRLACFVTPAHPLTPVVVELTDAGGMHEILAGGLRPSFNFNPCLTKKRAEIIPAAQADQQEDTVFFRDAPITAVPASEAGGLYAVAVDIGTTTIACALLDMQTGKQLGQAADINPQTVYGSDVLSRIEHAMQQPDGVQELQSLVVGCLNRLTAQLADQAGIGTRVIYAYAVAANTTMLHLLLGVNPRSLAMAPYTPVFTDERIVRTEDLSLQNCSADAVLCCLPSISAYIGADILAGIDISAIAGASDTVLFIDIGTNGEIVLSRRGTLSACSCAAGPALEGMNISCGMRAADGAIEQVQTGEQGFAVKTIGDAVPSGLCGSGVLTTMAALLRAGAVDPSGRIADPLPDAFQAHVRPNGKTPAFILSGGSSPVSFTQADVRQVQLAKGAILSGITALLTQAGLTTSDVDRVLIAGQFGAHLSEESLLDVGILPKAFEGRIQYVGNTSLTGAELFLLDCASGERMRTLSTDVSYLELSTYPGYTRLLMDCMKFPSD